MPLPALSELPLPAPKELSDGQQCGTNCVFCSAPLNNSAAVDLGARPVDAHGSSVLWFPRCCPSCRKAQT